MSGDQLNPHDVALYCGRGVCAAMEGHEGTCSEASGWEVDEDEVHNAAAWAAFQRVLRQHRRADPQREFDMAEPS